MTANFSRREFWCPCDQCSAMDQDERPVTSIAMVAVLQRIREKFGPVKVTSGVRCARHNAAIGGAAGSRHLDSIADAVDIACHSSVDRYRLVALAITCGVRRIKVYPQHIHMDMKPGPNSFLDEND